MGIAPVVQTWVEAGHTSFGEITIDDVRDVLVALSGNTRRHHAENGLKSLFKILKGRRLVFANPMKDIKVTPVATNIPLPLDSALVRAALDSPNPSVALAVALVAFHGLTGKQVRGLRVTDIADGRLLLDDRDIPLAAPVRTRVAAWLNHRNRTWPASANPHLLTNRRTAPRLVAVGPNYPWTKSVVRPRALREDRILHEIHATGSDGRRICDLFGLRSKAPPATSRPSSTPTSRFEIEGRGSEPKHLPTSSCARSSASGVVRILGKATGDSPDRTPTGTDSVTARSSSRTAKLGISPDTKWARCPSTVCRARARHTRARGLPRMFAPHDERRESASPHPSPEARTGWGTQRPSSRFRRSQGVPPKV
jgi:hypothetical protein